MEYLSCRLNIELAASDQAARSELYPEELKLTRGGLIILAVRGSRDPKRE